MRRLIQMCCALAALAVIPCGSLHALGAVETPRQTQDGGTSGATLAGDSGIIPLSDSGARSEDDLSARTPVRFELGVLAVAYDDGATGVRFDATNRLPGASGNAKVERKRGFTEIEIELDEMKPAWSFGGDFNTYLLWAISPQGHFDNLGEFILKGNRSKLNVTTPMDHFGLVVTAEPHFMVENPSPFVVLTNLVPRRSTPRPAEWLQLEVVSSHPGYRFDRTTLAQVPEVRDEVRSALRQAQVAVQLAAQAYAERLAPQAFKEAEDALLMAEGAAETRTPTDDDVELMARRAIRLATAAELQARKRNAEQATRTSSLPE